MPAEKQLFEMLACQELCDHKRTSQLGKQRRETVAPYGRHGTTVLRVLSFAIQRQSMQMCNYSSPNTKNRVVRPIYQMHKAINSVTVTPNANANVVVTYSHKLETPYKGEENRPNPMRLISTNRGRKKGPN